jgi:GT2 family glycosyltransferase
MSLPKKVAVVILGWNGVEFLRSFLPSVVQHTSTELCEIIVADNCSTDGSVDFVRKTYPNVRVIQNSRNGGYAGGYNDALRLVDAEYYVLLNQDIEVSENWIEAVITEMDKDASIAAAQPKLLDYNKRTHFEYAGACGGFVDMFGYAYCRGRLFDTIEKDEGQYDNATELFWASGACLFIRSDAYWKAGALDEDFFAHQEEIDLCWRLRNMGYRIISVPQSVVYHVGGGSLNYNNPRKTYLNFRNNLMMLFKNMPASELCWKLPVRLVLDMVAAFQSIWRDKNLKTLTAVAKALLAFAKALPALIQKRKAILSKKKALLTPQSIVWQYFALGKKTFSQLQ